MLSFSSLTPRSGSVGGSSRKSTWNPLAITCTCRELQTFNRTLSFKWHDCHLPLWASATNKRPSCSAATFRQALIIASANHYCCLNLALICLAIVFGLMRPRTWKAKRDHLLALDGGSALLPPVRFVTFLYLFDANRVPGPYPWRASLVRSPYFACLYLFASSVCCFSTTLSDWSRWTYGNWSCPPYKRLNECDNGVVGAVCIGTTSITRQREQVQSTGCLLVGLGALNDRFSTDQWAQLCVSQFGQANVIFAFEALFTYHMSAADCSGARVPIANSIGQWLVYWPTKRSSLSLPISPPELNHIWLCRLLVASIGKGSTTRWRNVSFSGYFTVVWEFFCFSGLNAVYGRHKCVSVD